MMPKPRILIAGLGRLGGSLGRALDRAGYLVRVVPHSVRTKARAKALGLELATARDERACQLCFVSVPDDLIEQVSSSLASCLDPNAALVHCAGALPLSAVRSEGRPRGSFHVLRAVSSSTDALSDCAVALAADTPWLLRSLRRVARDLGLTAFEVPERARARYHAAAVLCAGGLVALGSLGADLVESLGVPRKTAVTGLLSLMSSAVEGARRRGLQDGLTGPWARKDGQVIARHLDALSGDALELYRLLAERGLALRRSSLRALVPRQRRR